MARFNRLQDVSDAELSAVYRKTASKDGDVDDIIMELFSIARPENEDSDEYDDYKKIKQNLSARVSNLRSAARFHLAKQAGIRLYEKGDNKGEPINPDDKPMVDKIVEKVYKVFPQFRGRPERDMSELFGLLEEFSEV